MAEFENEGCSLPVIACDKREAFAQGSVSDEAIQNLFWGGMDCFTSLAIVHVH
jgi:hypothetical protein